MDLDQELTLRTAKDYANPGDETTVLPRSYGNFLSEDVCAQSSADVATPAALIDRLNWVYCINDGPVTPDFPIIMYNGVIQDPSIVFFDPNVAYEGRPPIAAIRFTVNPTHGVVSVRHGGSVDANGQRITNPVVGLYDAFSRLAGWTLNDFDLGTANRSLDDMNTLGYPFHWCFAESGKTIRDWLLEILPHYYTDFTETGNGQLAIILDRSLTNLGPKIDYHIPAYEIDTAGHEEWLAVTPELQADDVVNQVILHGRHNWVTNETSADYTWDFPHSQSAYNAAYPAEFTFRGMYSPAHAVTWLNAHALRHGFDPTVISFTMHGLKGIPLVPPRLITLEWPPWGWVQHLLKIRKTSIDFMRKRVSLECIDCQRELSDVVTSPNADPTLRRAHVTRTYSWVPGTSGDQGNLGLAPSDPRNEAANGDFEKGDNGQWDMLSGNSVPQWQIIDNPTRARSGRFYAVHQLNAGAGFIADLLQRITPGDWVVCSAWFRQELAGTNGEAVAALGFYTEALATVAIVLGSRVAPTSNYMESVAFAQAPPDSFYYRPGIGFYLVPTAGQWACDDVIAFSGSQAAVISSRRGSVSSGNALINGDFDLGDLMYDKGSGWHVTNYAPIAAHSGLWKAVHLPQSAPGEQRLTSMTQFVVTENQILRVGIWFMNIGGPTGQVRFGVTWLNPDGTLHSEFATPAASGNFPNYFLGQDQVTVPAGAQYAHVWLGITDHVGSNTFWVFDDWYISIS